MSNINQTEQTEASHFSLQQQPPPNIDTSPNPQSFNSYPPPTASYQDVVQSPDLFWEKLKAFHKSFGTRFTIPTVGGKPLDLHQLFVEVSSRGGLEQVLTDRRWKEVVASFNYPSTITSASFNLRKFYLSLLYHFEQVYLFHKEVPSNSLKDATNGGPANGSSVNNEGSAKCDVPGSPDLQFGHSVTGTIDAKFDNGYLITVQVGANSLRGVLYHVPQGFQVPQSSNTSELSTRRHRKRARDVSLDRPRPKSHRSGYNFFFAEHYARLKPSHHGQERLISKEIGVLWNNLSEEEKQVYQEKGLKDVERYRAEMEVYRSSFSQ